MDDHEVSIRKRYYEIPEEYIATWQQRDSEELYDILDRLNVSLSRLSESSSDFETTKLIIKYLSTFLENRELEKMEKMGVDDRDIFTNYVPREKKKEEE